MSLYYKRSRLYPTTDRVEECLTAVPFHEARILLLGDDGGGGLCYDGAMRDASESSNTNLHQTTRHAMGTAMTLRAYGPRAEEGLAAVCSELARIEGLLSRFLPGRDINRVNRWAGRRSERVDRETSDALSEAVENVLLQTQHE